MKVPFFYAKEFEDYLLTEKRYSLHTIVAYKSDLKEFYDFFPEHPSGVTFAIVRNYIVCLSDKQLENKSINRKLASLRTYFRFLLKLNVVNQNPLLKIQGPKTHKKLPVFAREKELDEEKVTHSFANDFDGIRDRLMFELFYQTGIRLSELINLKSNHVTPTSIKVLGKRNKERIIPISENLTKLINEYKSLKDKSIGDTEEFVVLNNGKKCYPKFVYRKISYYLGQVANLEVNSPHILRHTFATHMLNNGAGLETLKELLGHANLSATQVYTHNSFAQLTHIYSSAHPRGHKKK